ncbi:MAG: hypothetical protein ACLQVX_10065 [Limisphaerales bacterium]
MMKKSASLLLALICFCLTSSAGWGQLVSEVGSSPGPSPGGSGDSVAPVISADGQYIAFEASPATATYKGPEVAPAGVEGGQLLPVGASGLVLRYSLASGTTDLVSTNANMAGGDYGTLRSLDMTPDGRFVAFVANAAKTLGSNTCVMVWDAQSGTIVLSSGDLSNAVPAGSIAYWPILDASGRFVAFHCTGSNLVANTTGDHLYVRDLQAGLTVLVDADSSGSGSPIKPMAMASLRADGRFAAFECPDANLVPNGRSRSTDVFVRDLAGGTTELVSTRNAALPATTPSGPSILTPYSMTSDGRVIAFASEGADLTPGGTNGW